MMGGSSFAQAIASASSCSGYAQVKPAFAFLSRGTVWVCRTAVQACCSCFPQMVWFSTIARIELDCGTLKLGQRLTLWLCVSTGHRQCNSNGHLHRPGAIVSDCYRQCQGLHCCELCFCDRLSSCLCGCHRCALPLVKCSAWVVSNLGHSSDVGRVFAVQILHPAKTHSFRHAAGLMG